MSYLHARAILWWGVIAIWVCVLALAVPAFAQGASVRSSGSLISSASPAVGDAFPAAPSGTTHRCFQFTWSDGPPSVPYVEPWACYAVADSSPSACYWSGLITVGGVEYSGHRSACLVEFWSSSAAPPDPPASSASGAVACGTVQCLSEGTFEGWARVVAAFMVVVVWSLGIAHGRGAT